MLIDCFFGKIRDGIKKNSCIEKNLTRVKWKRKGKKKMKIGAQSYTIRNYCQNERDFGRSMEKVATMGYEVVQLSAIGPIAPQKVKNICDQNGLKIVLTHNAEQKFLTGLDEMIEEHQIYDCKYVGLGAMPGRYRDERFLPYFAEDFGKAAQKLRENGMLLMYHNHAFEFMRLSDGRTLMEHLLEMMPADIMGVTADTYWLQFAGVDVNQWMKQHSDRLACIHLKDLIPVDFEVRMAAVGEGNINFPGILETASNNGVTEYALVEQDNCYERSAFDCLKSSFDYLAGLGYAK